MSSPSGTDRIIALLDAPVSNSAGQTRLPTFSRMAMSTSSVPSASRPWRVISAVRWHIPPVCSCTAFAPAFCTVCASTSESISASIMPMRSSSFSASIVRTSVVVFPLPGEDMRLRRKRPLSFSSARRESASLLLSANTLCFISIVLSMVLPLSMFLTKIHGSTPLYCPFPNVFSFTV